MNYLINNELNKSGVIKQIIVFKTNVQTVKELEFLTPHINIFLRNANWNFDLEDCDNIFRVENSGKKINSIVAFFKSFGFDCEELN